MRGNFDRCLSLLFGDEGGYVNDPRDNGGATNFGVTQGTFDAWRRSRGELMEPVRSITRAEAAEIYKANYWDMVKADDLPLGLDYVVFDGAVNSGPGRSAKFLQQALMIQMDGAIGPVTLAAAAKADVRKAITDIKAIRMAFLRSLDDWSAFGRGWTTRVDSVTADALEMTGTAPAFPVPIEKPNVWTGGPNIFTTSTPSFGTPDTHPTQPVPDPPVPWYVALLRAILSLFGRKA